MDKLSKYWQDAEAYHRVALGAKKRPQVFTSPIVYNLLAMAIEKYFMAFFERHHTLPDNHTFSDLIDSAVRIVPLDHSLVDELKSLEAFQEICSAFGDYTRHEPDASQIDRMYAATERVAEYCKPEVS